MARFAAPVDLQNRDGDPAPAPGRLWYDSVNNELRYWNDAQVVSVAQGPAGPPGPPGTSTSSYRYNYSAVPTPPPNSGQVRTDGDTAATSTVVWVHRLDANNLDERLFLLMAVLGDVIAVQDAQNSASYASYRLTADPVDNGSYITYAVEHLDSGTPLVGSAVLLGVVREGIPGPPGPPGDPTTMPDGSLPLSKLAVDPLARANHIGLQPASTISDFDAAVRLSRLDQLAAPTGAVSFGNQNITNIALPVDDNDAATKAYVDSAGGPSGITPNPGWEIAPGYQADKTFDPENISLTELARTVGTLIDVLKTQNILTS